MNNDQTKGLCLGLMTADSEDAVIKLLSDAGFWNNPLAWREYGDMENNFSTIGNQQSRPDAALVEKCVNSEDARLMNECLTKGIDPESPSAPRSVRDAVARFFDSGMDPASDLAGRVVYWPDTKRKQIARGITVAATGARPPGKPCFTIADCGEGQTPEMIPETLLSLPTKSNKLRIPFVQGKFNMGATGVLKFCGHHNLQLVLTRRNPKIAANDASHPTDDQWGFTIVRRTDPAGLLRSSIYTYLAPLDATKERRGGVLRFHADELPLFPEGNNAYQRTASWGTVIKLYEYSAAGYSNTHILRRDGLLSRLDLLLPDPALPIRLHECRTFGGHEGSFDTTLTGLSVRLEDDKGDNLETGFPSSCPLSVEGEPMTATIYAFKKGKADTYRKNEGLIFTLNGQTHGHLTKDFFNRKSAGRLNYVADSILVIVDCSMISGRAREDLFMNSRDRLSGGDLRHALEDQLEEMLRQHQGLRALKEQRRNEEMQARLQDEKPLEDLLKSLLEKSPILASLFLQGQRLANPFKTVQVQAKLKEFIGKRHPTYFKFKDKEYGKEARRACTLGNRARITFETDAANDYFSRTVEKGEFSLWAIAGDGSRALAQDYVGPNLQNGIATLSVPLPNNCVAGDHLRFQAIVNDPTLLAPFQNTFVLEVLPAEQPQKPRTPIGPRKPPSPEKGEDRELPSGISLPKIIDVNENDWPKYGFTKHSALRIKITDTPSDTADKNGDSQDVYDFYINMDNFFLKNELKPAGDDVGVTRARWRYGLVLVGLALLHDDIQTRKTTEQQNDDDSPGENLEVRVERFTKAIAPVLLPMIHTLGTLEEEPAMAASASGEAT